VASHRNGKRERRVWDRHIGPALGALRAPDLDLAAVRRYVETKRAAGLGPATVRGHVRLLSALWDDLRERPRETGATGTSPCLSMPRSLRQQIRPTHDPRLTPYVERLADVRRIYQTLPEPYRTGYAVGALAGLRTGEVLALRWEHIDLDRRRLVVREAVSDGKAGPVKDSEARILPIAPELLSVLRARKLATGGTGLLVPPARPGRRSGPKRLPARFARSQTVNERLHAALREVGLADRDLDWYRATRHTYASHYVLSGGSLSHLATLLGHSSAEVTLRYAHLQPAALAEADIARIPVDLMAPEASVAPLIGQRSGRRTRHAAEAGAADALAEKRSRGRGGT
jgi:integrase